MTTKRILPDFSKPPLNEVVVGIQFDPLALLLSTQTKEVWELYRDEFPKVQEFVPIAPQFETYSNALPASNYQFAFGSANIRSRLWFTSENETQLVQFQNDRFLLNWRALPAGEPYPRFGRLASKFKSYATKLDDYCQSQFGQGLRINQTEVSYVNLIQVSDFFESSRWIKYLDTKDFDAENISCTLVEIIRDRAEAFTGRLYIELQSVCNLEQKQKALQLTLTVRGKSGGDAIDDSIAFLEEGHEMIVKKFTAITTDAAHVFWGREQ